MCVGLCVCVRGCVCVGLCVCGVVCVCGLTYRREEVADIRTSLFTNKKIVRKGRSRTSSLTPYSFHSFPYVSPGDLSTGSSVCVSRRESGLGRQVRMSRGVGLEEKSSHTTHQRLKKI